MASATDTATAEPGPPSPPALHGISYLRRWNSGRRWPISPLTRRILAVNVLALALLAGIAVAQYLCGLATVTSASRMAYAFARDGGLPWSGVWRQVSPRFRVPARSIWLVAVAAVLFTVYTPVYSTITVVCTLFLYLSYVLPAALGFFAHGRTWTQMGPWNLGPWFRPLAHELPRDRKRSRPHCGIRPRREVKRQSTTQRWSIEFSQQ